MNNLTYSMSSGEWATAFTPQVIQKSKELGSSFLLVREGEPIDNINDYLQTINLKNPIGKVLIGSSNPNFVEKLHDALDLSPNPGIIPMQVTLNWASNWLSDDTEPISAQIIAGNMILAYFQSRLDEGKIIPKVPLTVVLVE